MVSGYDSNNEVCDSNEEGGWGGGVLVEVMIVVGTSSLSRSY